MHVEVLGPHVEQGHYDLLGPQGEIILPHVWDTVIEPDWTITMHMWPMAEENPEPPPDDGLAAVVLEECTHPTSPAPVLQIYRSTIVFLYEQELG